MLKTIAALSLRRSFQAPDQIPAVDTAKHIGETVKVCGEVTGKHTAENVKGTDFC